MTGSEHEMSSEEFDEAYERGIPVETEGTPRVFLVETTQVPGGGVFIHRTAWTEGTVASVSGRQSGTLIRPDANDPRSTTPAAQPVA